MKLNTIVRLPDGREGTICWNHLDGAGGVWGRHIFSMPDGGFGDNLPAPNFMLRKPSVRHLLVKSGHRADVECAGEQCEIVEVPDETD